MPKQAKKKILYVVTKSSWGGAQRYVYDLATHFSGECDVVVAHGQNEFEGENIFVNKLQTKGIRTIELHSLRRDINLLREVKTFFVLTRLLWIEKPDIVHLNSSKIGLLVLLLCVRVLM